MTRYNPVIKVCKAQEKMLTIAIARSRGCWCSRRLALKMCRRPIKWKMKSCNACRFWLKERSSLFSSWCRSWRMRKWSIVQNLSRVMISVRTTTAYSSRGRARRSGPRSNQNRWRSIDLTHRTFRMLRPMNSMGTGYCASTKKNARSRRVRACRALLLNNWRHASNLSLTVLTALDRCRRVAKLTWTCSLLAALETKSTLWRSVT